MAEDLIEYLESLNDKDNQAFFTKAYSIFQDLQKLHDCLAWEENCPNITLGMIGAKYPQGHSQRSF